MSRPLLPILTLKFVTMVTSLEIEPLEKRVKSTIYDRISTMVKNLVKICPVDPEFSLLKVYFNKKEKK